MIEGIGAKGAVPGINAIGGAIEISGGCKIVGAAGGPGSLGKTMKICWLGGVCVRATGHAPFYRRGGGVGVHSSLVESKNARISKCTGVGIASEYVAAHINGITADSGVGIVEKAARLIGLEFIPVPCSGWIGCGGNGRTIMAAGGDYTQEKAVGLFIIEYIGVI